MVRPFNTAACQMRCWDFLKWLGICVISPLLWTWQAFEMHMKLREYFAREVLDPEPRAHIQFRLDQSEQLHAVDHGADLCFGTCQSCGAKDVIVARFLLVTQCHWCLTILAKIVREARL